MPANIRPITIPGFAGKLADVIEQIRVIQSPDSVVQLRQQPEDKADEPSHGDGKRD